jgi:hemolysin III
VANSKTRVKPLHKPKLRGYFHQEAFFVALGAAIILIAKCTSETSRIAAVIYSFGLLFLFGVSAIYHRPHWEPKPRAFMKRLDHSAIFILIASTFTPFCMMGLPSVDGHKLLVTIWAAASIGTLQSIFWIRAPIWITTIFYLIMGWLVFPYFGELYVALGPKDLMITLLGGLFYTSGAIIYAIRKPNPWPATFGYHEIFHVLVVIAAALHFYVIYEMIAYT